MHQPLRFRQFGHRAGRLQAGHLQRVATGDLSGYLSGDKTFERIILRSVAPQDQEWVLSDGRRLKRWQREVLEPGHDSIEEKYALFIQIGAYAYTTQYLQDCCDSTDGPMQFMHTPKLENWSPKIIPLKRDLFVARFDVAY